MTARGGVPTPPELRNMGPRGGPTYPLGIAERRHRNQPSLVKERNPVVARPACLDRWTLPASRSRPPARPATPGGLGAQGSKIQLKKTKAVNLISTTWIRKKYSYTRF